MDISLKMTTLTQWLNQLNVMTSAEVISDPGLNACGLPPQSASLPKRFVADSRRVQAGDVFFALPVGNSDGRDYISHAIAQGALAVVYEERDFSWNPEWTVPHLAVPDLLWQSGFIAGAYLEHPDAGMFVTAVTGTNGKTSCTQWIAHALSRLGSPTTVVGTLGVSLIKNGVADAFDVTGYTTPDAISLQQKLADQRAKGAKAVAIEASSIGLHQGRMNGMHVDVAVLTNFTRDHLDYHGDMAAYEATKKRLFEWPLLKTAVLNLDDDFGRRLAPDCQQRGVAVIGYTIKNRGAQAAPPAADTESLPSEPLRMPQQLQLPLLPPIVRLEASSLRQYHGGTSFQLQSPFGSGTVKTQMIGRFNVSNILAVMGTLFARGISWRDTVNAVEQLTSVPGRMEQLSATGRVLVVVDYAHTPDALEKTLENLREVAHDRQGKLWCVFGCGGDRDPGKRAQMGKIAEMADHVIVTSDNPRNEDPSSIIADIVAGMSQDKQPAPVTEADRAKAILLAIKYAAKNDVVLLAGKGHEEYQEIRGKKTPFSDRQHAEIALATIASKGVGL